MNLSSQQRAGDFVFVDGFTRPYGSCTNDEQEEQVK